MSNQHNTRTSKFTRMVKKFSLSAFVLATFGAYAIHERLLNSQGTASARASTPAPLALVLPSSQPAPTTTQDAPATAPAADAPIEAPPVADTPVPTTAPTDVPPPTAVPSPAPTTAGQYKDGQYTGPEVDAYYGMVQVQATIQQGKIADVQFLEYPNDRRTSIRINSQAVPYLTSEAIQAQSANVDVISGATLTSDAFVKSLQSALNSAQNR